MASAGGGERLREELAKLQVRVNEEKSRKVELQRGEGIGFLGFEFRRIRSHRGRWMPLLVPKGMKRTALLGKLKQIFRVSRSQPCERGDREDQSDSERLGEILRDR
jgi:RNA-directed DNA polymerase